MSSPSLPPGFRFHPTDEELILYYLRNRAASLPCPVSIIAEVDIYKFNPWDLPGKAKFGDREWYFFSPRDRKYPNGVRPNRAAASGYWKATGTDKPILSGSENLGVKKALVFYKGKPPKGQKTNWIMHEYRLAETKDGSKRPLRLGDSSMRLDDWVLCRIYQKSNHLHSMAPLADQEQEDSGTEDLYFPSLPNILQQQQEQQQQQQQQQQQDSLRIQKSSSLLKLVEDSDYSVLSQLLDNPSNFLGLEHDSLVVHRNLNQAYNNNNSNGVGYSIQHSLVPEIPVSIAESSLKRLKTVNGYSEVATDPLHAQKNLSSHMPANLTSQFVGHLHNMLN